MNAPRRLWAGGLALVLMLLLGLGVRAEALPPIAIGFYLPVSRDVPRKDVEVSLRYWTDELAHTLNVTYKPIEFYDDLGKLKHAMETGKVNFIVATSMGVVQHFSLEELGDGFSGYKALPDHLLLVVRRDAGIQSLADLAGKRVALLEGDELSDLYMETLLMKAWGKPEWSRLASVSRELRSSKLAHRLFFGQADAALILRNGYEAAVALNPQIEQRLRILDNYTLKIRSPHIGLFSAHVRPEYRETYTQGVMKLNDTARGRQVLQIYQADKMVRTPVSDLLPYKALLEEHSALKAAAGPARKRVR